jgi:hypothetical protein
MLARSSTFAIAFQSFGVDRRGDGLDAAVEHQTWTRPTWPLLAPIRAVRPSAAMHEGPAPGGRA